MMAQNEFQMTLKPADKETNGSGGTCLVPSYKEFQQTSNQVGTKHVAAVPRIL